jgi:hypothetical protein
VLSLVLANRELSYALEDVEHYKGGRVYFVERIRDIEFAEQGTDESELPELKSKLQTWDDDLNHYHFRVEVIKECVLAASRNLDNVEAMSPSEASNDDKETALAMHCLAEAKFRQISTATDAPTRVQK